MQFKIGNRAQIRECLLIKPPSETFKYSCKSFSFKVGKEAASNQGVYFRGDEVLFILLYAQQGFSSVEFFIVLWHLTSRSTMLTPLYRENNVVIAIRNNGNQSLHGFQFICMNK